MVKNNHPSSIINNRSAKRPVVVLGLGNPLMADEGVGVSLVARLAESAAKYPAVDFVDAGTGGLSLLYHIEGRHKAILIDCAFMDEPPGTIRRFTPDEVRSTKVLAHQSLHELDLMRVIAMAHELGQAPEEIVIFGIQPERIELDQHLSSTLVDKMDEYVATILHELEA
jgi:hydrogenase maturation protease